MPAHIHTEADLDAALLALTRADPRFQALIAAGGRPPLRRRSDGFPGLVAIVVAQQLSTASAAAIWGRIAAAFDPLEPDAILRARPARLARLGLSQPKIRTLKEIARAVKSGDLALAALSELAAEAAHAALTTVHGIGPWTADIYLLSCLGHTDAWPAGDLALQEAAKVAFALKTRPTAKEMDVLAEAWRPWRAIAARVLWSYYRTAKEAAKARTLTAAGLRRSGAKPSRTAAATTDNIPVPAAAASRPKRSRRGARARAATGANRSSGRRRSR
jgi:DNA-3-methyladenine glycosylase II